MTMLGIDQAPFIHSIIHSFIYSSIPTWYIVTGFFSLNLIFSPACSSSSFSSSFLSFSHSPGNQRVEVRLSDSLRIPLFCSRKLLLLYLELDLFFLYWSSANSNSLNRERELQKYQRLAHFIVISLYSFSVEQYAHYNAIQETSLSHTFPYVRLCCHFSPQERASGHHVLVLSYILWMKQTLSLNGLSLSPFPFPFLMLHECGGIRYFRRRSNCLTNTRIYSYKNLWISSEAGREIEILPCTQDLDNSIYWDSSSTTNAFEIYIERYS